MKYREESDSLGGVQVPAEAYYGAQTERSRNNFKIGGEKMPIEVIHAFALIKKAAAIVNHQLSLLPNEKLNAITTACDEIIEGKWDDHFPLVVWQTGSGTQSNMNVNEVIGNRASELLGGLIGSKSPVHPNDDVNKSQSSNDSFPTAMHIAAVVMIHQQLFPALRQLKATFEEKIVKYHSLVKIGRTHLMDATPLRVGDIFSRYASQLSHGLKAIEHALDHLYEIALGGTAVGTGINTPKGYSEEVADVIARLTGLPFITAPNKFEALATCDACVEMSGALKRLACSLFYIANDIRMQGSGPRCGIGELILPSNEPGSSIMPGKVNPTQCESMTMLCAQVMGNDATIGFAGSQGQFELNVFRPVIIYNLIQSIRLLADGMRNFEEKCARDLKPNVGRIQENLNNSLMLATVLNTEIGYDKASKIVKKAYEEGSTLKAAAVALGFLTEKRFNELVDPAKMV
jgi:fumarate hydratase class II